MTASRGGAPGPSTPWAGTAAPTLGAAIGLAVVLVAAWQVLFGSMVAWGPAGDDVASLLLPPAVALLVPVTVLAVRRWWSEPWLVGLPSGGSWRLLVPVLGLELLVVLQLQPPPASVLVAFLLTGASEELVGRGVVQQLLARVPRLPQVLLSGGLLALGYAVTLSLLDEATAKVVLVTGTVLCFGVAHAALRRRGVPVVVLVPMGALVVWPQAALEGYDPLTFVASVVALVTGLWATLDEPAASRGEAPAA